MGWHLTLECGETFDQSFVAYDMVRPALNLIDSMTLNLAGIVENINDEQIQRIEFSLSPAMLCIQDINVNVGVTIDKKISLYSITNIDALLGLSQALDIHRNCANVKSSAHIVLTEGIEDVVECHESKRYRPMIDQISKFENFMIFDFSTSWGWWPMTHSI